MTNTYPPTAVTESDSAPTVRRGAARTSRDALAQTRDRIARSMAELQAGDDHVRELLELALAAQMNDRAYTAALREVSEQTADTREVLRALADLVRANRCCHNAGCQNQTETPNASYCGDQCRDEAARQRRRSRQ